MGCKTSWTAPHATHTSELTLRRKALHDKYHDLTNWPQAGTYLCTLFESLKQDVPRHWAAPPHLCKKKSARSSWQQTCRNPFRKQAQTSNSSGFGWGTRYKSWEHVLLPMTSMQFSAGWPLAMTYPSVVVTPLVAGNYTQRILRPCYLKYIQPSHRHCFAGLTKEANNSLHLKPQSHQSQNLSNTKQQLSNTNTCRRPEQVVNPSHSALRNAAVKGSGHYMPITLLRFHRFLILPKL